MTASLSAPLHRFLPLLALGICTIGTAAAQPRLRLSETTLGPISIAVGANGATRSIDATNPGSGSLTLSARSSVSWIARTIGASRVC